VLGDSSPPYRIAPSGAAYARAEDADVDAWQAVAHAFERPSPRVPVRACLSLVLLLHEADRPRDAAALRAAFDRWLARSIHGHLRGELGTMWRAARELDALASRGARAAPAPVRAAVARGFRTGRLEHAAHALRAACDALPPSHRWAVRMSLREHAPSSFELLLS
jgi:hypothetical protein